MNQDGDSPPDLALLARILQGVVARIRAQGWTYIFARFEGHPIAYGYTVGLTETFGFPELVMLGVGEAVADHAFATLVARLRAGGVPPLHQPLDVGLTFPLVPRPIPQETARRHMPIANVFYDGRRSYDAVQLVWPDAGGRFPWEAGHQLAGSYQPLLCEGPPPD